MLIKVVLAVLAIPITLLAGSVYSGAAPEETPEPVEQSNSAVLVWTASSFDTAPSGLYVSVDAREFVYVPKAEFEEYYAAMAPPQNTCPTDPYPQCIGNTTCPIRPGKTLVGCVANFSDCGCLYISNPDGGADFDRAMVELYSPQQENRGEQEITFVDGGQVELIREATRQGLTLEYWLEL